MFSAHFGKSAGREAPEPVLGKPVSTFTERAKQIAKPFGADDALEAWTARMIAEADEFQSRRQRSNSLREFLR